MKKEKKKIIFFIIVFCIFLCKLEAISFKQLINLLKQKDESIIKLKADYEQLIIFSDLEENHLIEASFIYLKPDMLKINIFKPFNQQITVKGKDLWIKYLDNESKIFHTNLDKYFEKNQTLFPLILSKDNKYSVSDVIKKIGFKFLKEDENNYVLYTKSNNNKLDKTKDSKVEDEIQFTMWLDKKDLFIKRITLASKNLIIETSLSNYTASFDVSENDFKVINSTGVNIIELELK